MCVVVSLVGVLGEFEEHKGLFPSLCYFFSACYLDQGNAFPFILFLITL